MKYFLDTEFVEGAQSKRVPFTNIKYGKTKPTIDLISIGIVAEDNRTYYAISKDFNLKEAWDRHHIENRKKVYWLRENVLLSIFFDLLKTDDLNFLTAYKNFNSFKNSFISKNFNRFKQLINKYGKTNERIAKDLIHFCCEYPHTNRPGKVEDTNVEFYTYYGAYDWVVFCWLFGKMINLPSNFPMFSHDVKVMIDELAKLLVGKPLQIVQNQNGNITSPFIYSDNYKDYLKALKNNKYYPVEINSHNALDDAIWTKDLYKYVKTFALQKNINIGF